MSAWNRKVAEKMDITVDPESSSDEPVLNIGKITLGMKDREEMEDREKTEQNTKFLKAVCALLNSGGGVIKAQTENQDYSYHKHGLGEDLEESLGNIVTLVQERLQFKQEKSDISISVKSCIPGISDVQKPVTLATNLYMRDGASSIQMDLSVALKFFQNMRNTGGTAPLTTESLDQRSGNGDVQEEFHVQKLAAAFFDQKELTKREKFSFSESTNVEYKSFGTKKLLQRVKEILPRTVSAFANTAGGYLFIGLDEKEQQIIGFEAKNCDPVKLKTKIEMHIQQLPVTHFCEEKGKIQYTCKFIKVQESGAEPSYVCALRVERFCCAVFAAEPVSWHVEDSDVKRFTTEEWAKRLMASKPGSRRRISNYNTLNCVWSH